MPAERTTSWWTERASVLGESRRRKPRGSRRLPWPARAAAPRERAEGPSVPRGLRRRGSPRTLALSVHQDVVCSAGKSRLLIGPYPNTATDSGVERGYTSPGGVEQGQASPGGVEQGRASSGGAEPAQYGVGPPGEPRRRTPPGGVPDRHGRGPFGADVRGSVDRKTVRRELGRTRTVGCDSVNSVSIRRATCGTTLRDSGAPARDSYSRRYQSSAGPTGRYSLLTRFQVPVRNR